MGLKHRNRGGKPYHLAAWTAGYVDGVEGREPATHTYRGVAYEGQIKRSYLSGYEEGRLAHDRNWADHMIAEVAAA